MRYLLLDLICHWNSIVSPLQVLHGCVFLKIRNQFSLFNNNLFQFIKIILMIIYFHWRFDLLLLPGETQTWYKNMDTAISQNKGSAWIFKVYLLKRTSASADTILNFLIPFPSAKRIWNSTMTLFSLLKRNKLFTGA